MMSFMNVPQMKKWVILKYYIICVIDIAGIPLPQNLSGYSLLPLSSEIFKNENKFKNLHPPWILSEFHGCNVNASAYMLRTNQWKYIAYSDGASVSPQLFGKFADIYIFFNLYGIFFHYHLSLFPPQSPHCCPCPWELLSFCSIHPPPNLPLPQLAFVCSPSMSLSLFCLLVQFVH